MKKFVLLATLAMIALSAAYGQIKNDIDKSRTKKTAPAPAPPPPPAPVSKSTAATTTTPLVYTLTSARVKVRTGNDNKEFPSKVLVSVATRNIGVSEWPPFYQQKLDNEMRINSETEFGLERDAQLRGEIRLDAFQAAGVKLKFTYLPNLIFDAWKIESITLILEFKDQYGNLHPTLGNKTIVFSNAYGLVNNDYRIVECTTDGNFAPMTAIIKK